MKLNLDVCYQTPPPPVTSIQGAVIPTNWLQILISYMTSDPRKINEILEYYSLQIGDSSTHPLKNYFKNILQHIYTCHASLLNNIECKRDARRRAGIFTDNPEIQNLLGKANQMIASLPIEETELQCTPGFYDRLKAIIQNMDEPTNFAELLSKIRSDIVENEASKTTSEIHAKTRFSLIAAVSGYGVIPTNEADVHPGGLSDEEITRVLHDAFKREHNNFFNILKKCLDYIRGLLMLRGYNGRKPPTESYTYAGNPSDFSEVSTMFRLMQKYCPHIPLDKHLSTCETRGLFQISDDSMIFDLDWGFIHIYVLIEFLELNYFSLTPRERDGFNALATLLQTRIRVQNADIHAFLSTQFFSSARTPEFNDLLEFLRPWITEAQKFDIVQGFIPNAHSVTQLLAVVSGFSIHEITFFLSKRSPEERLEIRQDVMAIGTDPCCIFVKKINDEQVLTTEKIDLPNEPFFNLVREENGAQILGALLNIGILCSSDMHWIFEHEILGVSGLSTFLLCTTTGIVECFSEIPALTQTITIHSLIKPIMQGPFRGMTAFHFLSCFNPDSNRKLLSKLFKINPHLAKMPPKIMTQRVSGPFPETSGHYSISITSPFYVLCTDAMWLLKEIFNLNPMLFSTLSFDDLTKKPLENWGTALSHLCDNEENKTLLKSILSFNPSLHSFLMQSAKNRNLLFKAGILPNPRFLTSTTYTLEHMLSVVSGLGREIINDFLSKRDPAERYAIRQDLMTMNKDRYCKIVQKMIEENVLRGDSFPNEAFFNLLQENDGIRILVGLLNTGIIHPSDISQIFETEIANGNGLCGFLVLCVCGADKQILGHFLDTPVLVQTITLKSLIKPITHGSWRGLTAFYYLSCFNPDSNRKLLSKLFKINPHLAKMPPEIMTQRVSGPFPKTSHPYTSPFYVLCTDAMWLLKEIFNLNPMLFSTLSFDDLTKKPLENWGTALSHLCDNEENKTLLKGILSFNPTLHTSLMQSTEDRNLLLTAGILPNPMFQTPNGFSQIQTGLYPPPLRTTQTGFYPPPLRTTQTGCYPQTLSTTQTGFYPQTLSTTQTGFYPQTLSTTQTGFYPQTLSTTQTGFYQLQPRVIPAILQLSPCKTHGTNSPFAQVKPK